MNILKTLTSISVVAILAGCSTSSIKPGKDSFSIINGPTITRNNSQSTVGLMCVGNTINNAFLGKRKVRIAIGSINDLTGKFSDQDGGYKVTQGAQLMAYSALQKMKAVKIVERSDTQVFKFETDLSTAKMLGDKVNYRLPNGVVINYRPMISGSILGSSYYITGGITEINYNIYSNGSEIDIAFFGGIRQYVMNIAMDLRLVNSRTLEVVSGITLQKQIVGYETKAGVFKFFGNDLIDLNIGSKVDEPVNLGIRAIIEQGIAELVGSLYKINTKLLFDGLYAKNKVSDDWIQRPERVAKRICPRIKIAKPIKKVLPQPLPRPQPKQKKFAILKKSSYLGSCSAVKSTCEMCKMLKTSKHPSKLVKGSYVQMSAYSKPSGCLNEYACLSQKHGDLFKNKSYSIAKRTNSKGEEWHGLLVGPFKTNQKASQFCSTSKLRGLDCFVKVVK
jgi:curli biogenesis system outer membrane secretion channel CsgG